MRALWLIAIVLGACGFAPEDDFTGRRIGDGIAPWTDLGPVQLCFGGEFVGPPDSTPGGLCGDENESEAPCTGDGDCRSREACVCGRCTIQYCTVGSDCTDGRVCSFSENRCDRPCAVDDDCALDEECFNSTCRGRCADDSECQTGEVCSASNRCVTASCAGPGDCLAGERCRIQRVPRVATEPTVLVEHAGGEPRYVMWLELSDDALQDQRAIWRATSLDGQRFRFDPARPVLEDGGAAGAPSVVRTEAGYFLYYERGAGAAIAVAQSPDGIAFGSPTTALPGGQGPAAARAPAAVVLPDGQIGVYYQVGTGSAIALARGVPGAALTSAGPVLTPRDVEDPPASAADQRWIEIASLRSPAALVTAQASAAPLVRMWFAALGRESGDSEQFGETVPIAASYSVGYADIAPADPTALTVWPFNPVLDRVDAFLDHRHEIAPAVVQRTDGAGNPQDEYLLYYVDAQLPDGQTEPGPGRIGVARNGGAE